MTRRYLQDRYQIDDEECARPRRSFPCQECSGMNGQHQANCPNAPDEPEQDGGVMKAFDDDGTELYPCHSCENGTLMIECCNGSSGCDCGGQPVDMGPCRSCNGTGWARPEDEGKSLEYIREMAEYGRGYLGSGPRYR